MPRKAPPKSKRPSLRSGGSPQSASQPEAPPSPPKEAPPKEVTGTTAQNTTAQNTAAQNITAENTTGNLISVSPLDTQAYLLIQSQPGRRNEASPREAAEATKRITVSSLDTQSCLSTESQLGPGSPSTLHMLETRRHWQPETESYHNSMPPDGSEPQHSLPPTLPSVVQETHQLQQLPHDSLPPSPSIFESSQMTIPDSWDDKVDKAGKVAAAARSAVSSKFLMAMAKQAQSYDHGFAGDRGDSSRPSNSLSSSQDGHRNNIQHRRSNSQHRRGNGQDRRSNGQNRCGNGQSRNDSSRDRYGDNQNRRGKCQNRNGSSQHHRGNDQGRRSNGQNHCSNDQDRHGDHYDDLTFDDDSQSRHTDRIGNQDDHHGNHGGRSDKNDRRTSRNDGFNNGDKENRQGNDYSSGQKPQRYRPEALQVSSFLWAPILYITC